MATHEWARFNFFDLRSNPVDGLISKPISSDAQITSATYGNGHIVICDNEGNIYIYNRLFQCTTIKGHDAEIKYCCIALQSSLLVTLGAEENDNAPIFKIWNLAKVEQKNAKLLLRAVKINYPRPCALAVSDNGQFMAIGFQRGNISLYRGDISRDRSKTLKPLVAGTMPIVGIAFKHYERNTYMFACSNSGVYVFQLLSKDRETKLELDRDTTSELRCCDLQAGQSETHFMVGCDDAVYCYTLDGRGPCYVLDGKKRFIKWFRNHLIVITDTVVDGQSAITVIDLLNKFIVFSVTLDRVVAVFVEFGQCFVVTEDKVFHHISEKDLQSKLSLLYKKNLFDIAVRVADSQQMGGDVLAEIYRQHGDHLYNKSQFDAAVEQYIKTIGHLEPSYIIRKFMDPRHIQYLSTYLEALHEKRLATTDHTTLLINCLTRLEQTEKLEEFFNIYSDKDVAFDVEVAADVCRETMAFDQALMLTAKREKHTLHIDILLNDVNRPADACSYIANIPAEDAKEVLLTYGPQLMDEQPAETLAILKHVCKETYSLPDEFFFIFADASDTLLDFLEDAVLYTPTCSQLVYDTLIELHLKNQKPGTKQKLMDVLGKKGEYDRERAIFLCRDYKFNPGLLYLFGEEELSHLIVRSCVQNEDYDELLNCCQRLGISQPSLWLQALMGIRNSNKAPLDLVQKILHEINNEKLLSPLQVSHAIAFSVYKY